MNVDYCLELLIILEEKLVLFEEMGVDYCFMFDFICEVLYLIVYEFMFDILRDCYWVQIFVIGYDYCFGYNCSEGFEDYCCYGFEMGIEVICVCVCVCDDFYISFFVICKMLYQGEVDWVVCCLGYDYFLDGMVVSGYQVGRKIGFFMVNFSVDDFDKLVFVDGVYVVYVMFDGYIYNGMFNIGICFMIGNGFECLIEVNIFYFYFDIYDKFIWFFFVKYFCLELKFDGIEGLIVQFYQDVVDVEVFLGKI